MGEVALLFLIVFAIHLAPAFTPPTWPVIALYALNTQLPMPLLVVTAAAAAALGRYVLGWATNLFEHRFPARLRNNLEAAGELIERRPANRAIGLALFVFAPVPSAQLFEAAGLIGVRLWPCALAFFIGRLGYYSLYAFTARQLQASSLLDDFRDQLTSPAGIALQLLVITGMILLMRVDWTRWLKPQRRP
jgi:membrane protein YqaA with SNARE-associated domain